MFYLNFKDARVYFYPTTEKSKERVIKMFGSQCMFLFYTIEIKLLNRF